MRKVISYADAKSKTRAARLDIEIFDPQELETILETVDNTINRNASDGKTSSFISMKPIYADKLKAHIDPKYKLETTQNIIDEGKVIVTISWS